MDFPGCVIIVSHDRYFMDKLVDHLWVLDDSGEIRDFPGTYTEYRSEVGTDVFKSVQKKEESKKVEAVRVEPKKKAALSYFEKKELNELDESIPKLESRKAKIMDLFNAGDLTPEKSSELSLELGNVQDELDASELRWLELMEKKESSH